METEDNASETLATWCRYKKIRIAHLANERKTFWITGAKLKRMGVSRGVPDYMIIINKKQAKNNKAKLVFIELKRSKRMLKDGSKSKADLSTPEQKEWLKELNMTPNVNTYLCYGSGEAIDILEELISD